jgi:hypothetical protein
MSIDVSADRAAYFLLVSCLDYSPTLRTEVTYSSETSVNFQWTIQCYIQENRSIPTYSILGRKEHANMQNLGDSSICCDNIKMDLKT